MGEFSSLQKAVDEQQAETDVLSENKVQDLVTIANGNIIGNEQQMVLGHLSLMTGYMYAYDRNVCTILTGPSAGGKSMTQECIMQALPMDNAYKASDASSMGILDDDRWDKSLFAPLDEWQKIPDKLTEILKGVAGGADDEYRYVRSVSDDDSSSGRKGHMIVKKSRPFQFLYAQHALDHELSTRLVFLPIDDNVDIREAIVEYEGGATDINVSGYDKEFIFETTETERAIRQHLRELPTMVEDDSGHKRGLSDAVLPPWVRKSVKPIFDMDRTGTNRVAGQVFNLIRASTVVNYDNRETVSMTPDGTDDVEVTQYIAEPQDVANVMSCRETLLSKTHKLTKIKRKIIDAIRAQQHFDDSEGVGVTIKTIRNYLDSSSSLSVPSKSKLRDLLRELDEQFYIDIHEGAGPNGSHLYQYVSLRDIGVPRTGQLAQFMNESELTECEELSPDVDLADPFADSVDPFRDQPFKETVTDMRNELSDSPVERAEKTAELAAEEGGSGGSDPKGESGEYVESHSTVASSSQSERGEDGSAEITLQDAMGPAPDDPTPEEIRADLGIVETEVYDRLRAYADEQVWDLSNNVSDEHLLGVVEPTESLVDAEITGTIYDPNHELWDDPRKPDDWVNAQADAESLVEQAVSTLDEDGILQYDTEDTPDGFVATVVVGEE